MTVQELIDKLKLVKDKSIKVWCEKGHASEENVMSFYYGDYYLGFCDIGKQFEKDYIDYIISGEGPIYPLKREDITSKKETIFQIF